MASIRPVTAYSPADGDVMTRPAAWLAAAATGDGGRTAAVDNPPMAQLSERSAFVSTLAAILMSRPEGVVLFHVELLDVSDVSNTFGPAICDIVVRGAESRIRALANPDSIIAWLGESRLAVVMYELEDEAEIDRIGADFCKAAMEPVQAGANIIGGIACVGAASWVPELEARELTIRADAALLEAQRGGGGRVCRFTDEMDSRIRRRTLLRHSLQHAISGRQLHTLYQPLVDLRTERVVGAEALLRWNHPTLGSPSPESFIPLAEETGVIVPIGMAVLHMALGNLQRWLRAGLLPPRISVNVSGVQIRRCEFPGEVAEALRRFEVPAAYLELELTEGALIDNSRESMEVVRTLSGLGISLAIDDFGTGYSSLRYLRDLPVNTLKIDKSFIRNLSGGPRDLAMLVAMVQIADSFGLATVAEGIETRAQFEQVRDIGCTRGQGWLFGRPGPAEDLVPEMASAAGAMGAE